MRSTRRLFILLPTMSVLGSSGPSDAPRWRHAAAPEAPAFATAQQTLGSSVPCAVPLPWRLAETDARFGLSRTDAEAALRAAFGVWEDELGGDLFAISESGHPVTFQYDEGQASSQRRRAERAAAAQTARELEAMAARLEERLAAQRRENAALVEAAAAHRRRTLSLNQEVTSWNQRGDVPDSVRTRIRTEQAALAAEGQDLDRRQRVQQELSQDLSAESRRLNLRIEAFSQNQVAATAAAARPWQAGRYDEQVRTRNGRVEEIRRSIVVYSYGSAEDLVIVLAHELGHALGLGHSDEMAAIMSEVHTTHDGGRPPRLHPRDVEMFYAACPSLR